MKSKLTVETAPLKYTRKSRTLNVKWVPYERYLLFTTLSVTGQHFFTAVVSEIETALSFEGQQAYVLIRNGNIISNFRIQGFYFYNGKSALYNQINITNVILDPPNIFFMESEKNVETGPLISNLI